jgi:hypothetical protein
MSEEFTNSDHVQRMQITTWFPITWRHTFNQGTGGIEVNASLTEIEFVFGDERFYSDYTEATTNEKVFATMYACGPLAELDAGKFKFVLDDWCNSVDYFAQPFRKTPLCQGGLYVEV